MTILLRRVASVLGVVVVFSLAGYAQQALDNQAIVKMVKSGLSEELVLSLISSQPAQFSMRADDVIALKKDGVSDKVIAAMASKGKPTAPGGPVPAANSTAPGQDKPSDAQVLSAIRTDPNRNNTQSPTALVVSTNPIGSGTRIRNIDVSIEGFRLVQWGEFNSAGKYWSVELCVNGTAENTVLAQFSRQERSKAGGPPGPVKFEAKTRYRLFKDDFGDVKAEQVLVREWKPQDSLCPSGPPKIPGHLPPNGSSKADADDGLSLPADGVKASGDLARGEFEVISKVLVVGSGSSHPGRNSTVTVVFQFWKGASKILSGPPTPPRAFRPRDEPTFGATIQLMVVGEKRRLWYSSTSGPLPGSYVVDLELISIK